MLELNIAPFPALSTERLDLKRLSDADLDDLFLIRSNKETMRFIPRPVAQSKEDAKKVMDMINEAIDKNDGINWGLYLKDTGRLIGVAGFVRLSKSDYRGEVGYVLNAAYHKKGYMKEALDTILDYGFNKINFNCIEAVIDPENTDSVKVIEKFGFKRDGRLRDYTFHNEQFSDAFIYSKLRREHVSP